MYINQISSVSRLFLTASVSDSERQQGGYVMVDIGIPSPDTENFVRVYCCIMITHSLEQFILSGAALQRSMHRPTLTLQRAYRPYYARTLHQSDARLIGVYKNKNQPARARLLLQYYP